MATICKYRIDTVSDPNQSENQINLGITWWLEKSGSGDKIAGDFQTSINVSDASKSSMADLDDRMMALALDTKEMLSASKKLTNMIGGVREISLS